MLVRRLGDEAVPVPNLDSREHPTSSPPTPEDLFDSMAASDSLPFVIEGGGGCGLKLELFSFWTDVSRLWFCGVAL